MTKKALLHREFPDDYFSDAYRQIIASSGRVHESDQRDYEPILRRVREKLVHCVWLDQRMAGKDVYVEDGRRLTILAPGWWNLQGGPDFSKGRIALDGNEELVGDIEAHVRSSGWYSHGHHKNPRYDDVILHVVMWSDSDEPSITNSRGRAIPELVLSRYLDRKPSELAADIDVEDYVLLSGGLGPCHDTLDQTPGGYEWLGGFLDFAGNERMLMKANSFQRKRPDKTFDELLYEGTMTAMGYKLNKAPFMQVAARLPLTALSSVSALTHSRRDKALAYQALLFGLAGFLDEWKTRRTTFDEETLQYLNALLDKWETYGKALETRPLDARQWRRFRTRPVNYPERRIAGMSHFLAAHMDDGLFHNLLTAFDTLHNEDKLIQASNRVARQLADFFCGGDDPYWSYRYTLGGKRRQRPLKLIGGSRADIVIVNVVVPLLLAYCREKDDMALEKSLHALYRSLKGLAETDVGRFMKARMPGIVEGEDMINTARRQQGLLQLYADYCEDEEAGCDKCPLGIKEIA